MKVSKHEKDYQISRLCSALKSRLVVDIKSLDVEDLSELVLSFKVEMIDNRKVKESKRQMVYEGDIGIFPGAKKTNGVCIPESVKYLK